jgi:eukaryotic-like serine/threonine-protein kinase
VTGAGSGNGVIDPRLGQTVAGHYNLLSVLGSGGQGIVYRARDERDGDEVAVKVLRAEFADDAGFRERMLREAQALTALSGTAAVQVLDEGPTPDGAHALVMELLRGEELADYLHRLKERGERLSIEELLRILEPVATTLEVAHSQGIVHRDLKPGNVFIVRDPEFAVRVLDFGFARFLRKKALTAAGFIAGSPTYIAPEAWRGKAVDHRADIYSLGAIVFRGLTGRAPFESNDLRELLALVTTSERPSLHALRPDLPKEIDDWVNMALAIDPDQRFLKVSGFWAALTHCVQNGSRTSAGSSAELQASAGEPSP